MMNLLLVVAHGLVCVILIALVLMQQGKGADSAFGTGASSTVFGSKGSNAFIVKATALIAFAFFVTTTSLTTLTQYQAKHQSVLQHIESVVPTTPLTQSKSEQDARAPGRPSSQSGQKKSH